ncbi:MAG: hypothetical protein LBB68_07895 [Treponema sp.]|jgi:hypothetical protein|nr:hypothetical protein [Treponema sp.]
MHEKEKAFVLKETCAVSVVPIILSECGWRDVKDVSNILALSTDGYPIANYDDSNKGWNEVYNGLKRILERKNKEKSATIKTSFKDFLNDAEMLKSAHSQKTSILLSDIFIFPNLSKFNYDDEKENAIDLFSNRRDDIMTAWEGEKKRRMLKRFFLNGCTG